MTRAGPLTRRACFRVYHEIYNAIYKVTLTAYPNRPAAAHQPGTCMLLTSALFTRHQCCLVALQLVIADGTAQPLSRLVEAMKDSKDGAPRIDFRSMNTFEAPLSRNSAAQRGCADVTALSAALWAQEFRHPIPLNPACAAQAKEDVLKYSCIDGALGTRAPRCYITL